MAAPTSLDVRTFADRAEALALHPGRRTAETAEAVVERKLPQGGAGSWWVPGWTSRPPSRGTGTRLNLFIEVGIDS